MCCQMLVGECPLAGASSIVGREHALPGSPSNAGELHVQA